MPTTTRPRNSSASVRPGRRSCGVIVNRFGFEPDPSGQTGGIQFWGSSFVAGPQGEILYEACDDDEESIVIEIDLARSEQVRRWWPFLRDRCIDRYTDILRRYIDK